jgi:hypothetical protein
MTNSERGKAVPSLLPGVRRSLLAVRFACLDPGGRHFHNATVPPDENTVSGLPVLLKGTRDTCFNTLVNPLEQVFRGWFLHHFIREI